MNNSNSPGSEAPRLLNLGCGSAFHPDWVNLDSFPAAPGIVAHDLNAALPFPDGRFDVVYASHVLEHLDPNAGLRLLCECNRILGHKGILRVVVPDLERIASLYLESLAGAVGGDPDAAARYEWMMLELYDQTVRTVPGGRMATYLAAPLEGEQGKFVTSRIGEEALHGSASPLPRGVTPFGWRFVRRLCTAVTAARRFAAETFTLLLLGREGRAALKEGLFRRGGEVHRWMYDRYSLQQAFDRAGFVEVRIRRAGESDIAGFERYGLEVRNGLARKPDSICMEGRKPPA